MVIGDEDGALNTFQGPVLPVRTSLTIWLKKHTVESVFEIVILNVKFSS